MDAIKTISLILGAAAVLSCSKQEKAPSVEPPLAVTFGAVGETRAPGETADVATDGYAFGVFAFDTGLYRYSDSNVNPNFMYNERVSYDAAEGLWSYSPVKYWPNGEGEVSGNTGVRASLLSFFAYAPYSDMQEDNPAGYCITSMSGQAEPGNPWIVYRIHEDVSQQVDLLCAPAVVDQVKPDVDARIGFGFTHALACAGEKVYVTCSSALRAAADAEAEADGGKVQVILDAVSVRYHLTERARLTLWSTGQPRWQALLNGEPTTDRTVVYGEGLDHLAYSTDPADGASHWDSPDGMGVFYIPVDMPGDPQTATVRVDFTVRRVNGGTTDTAHSRESSFRLSRYPEAFAPGKKLGSLSISIQ